MLGQQSGRGSPPGAEGQTKAINAAMLACFGTVDRLQRAMLSQTAGGMRELLVGAAAW